MRLFPNVLAAAILFAPGVANAAVPDRMIVLPVLTGGDLGQATFSSVYRDVGVSTAKFLGIRTVSDEELFAGDRQEMVRRLVACGADVACVAEGLARYDAQVCLIIAVNELVDPPFIAVRLLDLRQKRLVGQADGPADGTIAPAIQGRTEVLLNTAGYLRSARIEAAPAPSGALVSLEPHVEPNIGTPNVFTVPPGRYRVRGALDGHEDTVVDVEVAGGERRRVDLELEPDTPLLRSPWLWIGAGVVAVAAGVSVAVVASAGLECVCAGPAGTPCPPCP